MLGLTGSRVSWGFCGSPLSNHTAPLQIPNHAEDTNRTSNKQAITLIFYQHIFIFRNKKRFYQGFLTKQA